MLKYFIVSTCNTSFQSLSSIEVVWSESPVLSLISSLLSGEGVKHNLESIVLVESHSDIVVLGVVLGLKLFNCVLPFHVLEGFIGQLSIEMRVIVINSLEKSILELSFFAFCHKIFHIIPGTSNLISRLDFECASLSKHDSCKSNKCGSHFKLIIINSSIIYFH